MANPTAAEIPPGDRASPRRPVAWAATLLLLALAGLMAWMQGRYLLAPNQSGSLPGSMYLINLRERGGFAPGDAVAFRHDAERWGFPDGATWVKQVRGLPGEGIAVIGGRILVGGRDGGRLDEAAMARADLSPVAERAVPADHLYVAGMHRASLDSRYAEFGFVPLEAVVGKATRLW